MAASRAACLLELTEGTGKRGSVVVKAPHVTLTEGAQISSLTLARGGRYGTGHG